MRSSLAAFVVLATALPAQAQFRNRVNLERLNRSLDGWVDDSTHIHGQNRRIDSPILGRPRDLYVSLPPGDSPRSASPLEVATRLLGANNSISLR